jgi:tetratricopeptide (TPR) repeat protein
LGCLEMWADDASAAESAFRATYVLLEESGDNGHLSTAAAELALALCHLERFDEAEGYAHGARALAAEDDLASQTTARAAEARVLSARGNHAEAVSLARDAVQLYAAAETPNYQAEMSMVLSEVLRSAGDLDEAAIAAREALGFFEAKANRPAAALARSLLDSLTR